MPQLVGDGEPPPRRPLSRLLSADPNLPAIRQEQAGERLAVAQRWRARCGPQVVNVPDQQTREAVGDLLDRDWQRFAVPDVRRHTSEETLRELLSRMNRHLASHR